MQYSNNNVVLLYISNFETRRMEMDDQQIISLFMARSEQAIEESTNKYGTYLTKIAMNILHNTEDASECVNDTWLKAWKNIPPTIPKSLFAFLSTIARNTSFDLYRTKHLI